MTRRAAYLAAPAAAIILIALGFWSIRAQAPDPLQYISIEASYYTLTITFDEPLDPNSVPETGAFNVGYSGERKWVRSISVVDHQVYLRFDFQDSFQADEYPPVKYTPPAQNPLRSADGSRKVARIDYYDLESSTPRAAPAPETAWVDGRNVVIEFDVWLTPGAKRTPSTNHFSVAADGNDIAVESVYVTTRAVWLHLAEPVDAEADVSLTYRKPNSAALLGLNGEEAPGFSLDTLLNRNGQTPALTDATLANDGRAVTLTFDKSLSAAVDDQPISSAFTVSGGADVDTVAIDGTTIVLTLDAPISPDDDPTIAYAPPADALDGWLRGANDLPVAAWSDYPIAGGAPLPPNLIDATALNDAITLTFDQPLNSDSSPPPDSFSITRSASSESQVAEVVIEESTVTLRLDAPVGDGDIDMISIAYSPPDEAPLRAAADDLPVETFSRESITNNTDFAPVQIAAEVAADGSAITVTFNEPLRTGRSNFPSFNWFALTGATREVVEGESFGETITLSLDGPVSQSDELTLAYTTQPLGTRLRDANQGQLPVASWSNLPVVNNADTAPILAEAYVTGAELRIVYDQPLDTGSVPPGAAWSFTIDFEPVIMSSITIVDNTVIIVLASEVQPHQVLSVTYRSDRDEPLRDEETTHLAPTFTVLEPEVRTPQTPPEVGSAIATDASLRLIFTAPLDGDIIPSASSFTISTDDDTTPAATEIAVNGNTVSLTLSPPLVDGAVATLAYAPPDSSPLTGANGVIVVGFNSQPISNETDTAPVPISATTTADGTEVAVVFSEPLHRPDNIAALTAAFTLGTTGISVTSVATDGATVTLTLNRRLREGEAVPVAYTPPSDASIALHDADQAMLAVDAFTIPISNQVDSPPALSAAATNLSGNAIVLTFSENLNPAAAGHPPITSFTLSGTDAAVTSITISANSATLSLEPPAAEGDVITVTYIPPIDPESPRLRDSDQAESPVAAFERSVDNLVDTPPLVISAAVNGPSVTLTFDQPLDIGATPANTTFTLDAEDIAVLSVSVEKSTVTLLLSNPAADGMDITLTYTPSGPGALRDPTNMLVAPFTRTLVNLTDDVPAPLSVATSADGGMIIITFSEPLDGATPATETFTLSGDSTISGLSIDDSTVLLTVNPPIAEGKTLSLSYAPPLDQGSPRLRDADQGMLPIIAFDDVAVVNNVNTAPIVTAATVDGDEVTLTFDQPLKVGSTPPNSTFSIDGSDIDVIGVTVWEETVTLLLRARVADGAEITLTYAPADRGALRDPTDMRVQSFTRLLDNVTDDRPALVSASTDSGGASIILTFSESLHPLAPLPATFTVVGSDASVTGVEVHGEVVTLTVSPPILEGKAVNLSYLPPADLTSARLRDADQGMLPVLDFAGERVENLVDNAPIVIAAEVEGQQITITFDQALDADSLPATSAFSVDLSGVAVSEVGIQEATLTLGLSERIADGAGLSVTYSAEGEYQLRDSTGMAVIPFSRQLRNLTDDAPVLIAAQTNESGSAVVFIFSEHIDAAASEAGAFTFTGTDSTALSVTVSSDRVTVVVSPTIAEGVSLTASYAPPLDPTSSRLRDADQGQLAVVSFDSIVVQNFVNTAPVVTAASVDGRDVVISFDQALDPDSAPSTDTFTFREADLSVTALAVSERSVTLTLSRRVREGAAITLWYSPATDSKLADTTGMAVAAFTRLLDNLTDDAPTLISAETDVSGGSISLTFSEALAASAASPSTFSLAGSDAAVDGVAIGGTMVTLTVSPLIAEGEMIALTYAPPDDVDLPRLRDADQGMMAVAGFEGTAVTNHADTAPVVVLAEVNGHDVTFTFDQVLSDAAIPESGTFSVDIDGIRAIGVNVAGNGVLVTLSEAVQDGATVTGSYAPAGRGTLRDPSDLLVAAFSIPLTNVTDTAPKLLSAETDVDGTALVLTFNEALDASSDGSPPLSNLEVTGTAAEPIGLQIEGATATLALEPPALEGDDISVAYEPPVEETAGRLRDGDQGMLAVAGWLPRTAANRIDERPYPLSAASSAAGDEISLTFNEPLDVSADGWPAADRFTLAGTSGAVTGVAVSGDVVRLAVSPRLREGEVISVSYAPPMDASAPRLRDVDQRMLDVGAWQTLPVRNDVDTTPVIVEATVDGSTARLTFTFGLAAEAQPATDGFGLAGTASAVSGARIDGTLLELALTPAAADGDTITLTYTPPANGGLRDLGNDLLSMFSVVLTNSTDTAPYLIDAATTLDGSSVILTFNEPLDRNLAGTPSLGTLTITGIAGRASGMSLQGATVRIGVDPAVREGEALTLSYASPLDPTAARLRDADQAMLPVADWSDRTVRNLVNTAPIPVSATVDGVRAVITFDQVLAEDSAPGSDWFSFVGTSARATMVVVSGDGVIITLSAPAADGADLSVSYSPPSDTPLQDATGMLVEGFTRALDNLTDTAPQLVAAETSTDGAALTLTFSETLAAAMPAAALFRLDGSDAAVATAEVVGHLVRLAVSPSIREGESVKLGYTPPLDVNAARLRDADQAMRAVAGFADYAVSNLVDTAPAAVSGSVDGQDVTITFDQILYAGSIPENGTFAVDVDGVAVIGVGVWQQEVTLTLSRPVEDGADLSVTYTPSGSGRLRDSSDLDVEAFTIALTNLTDTVPLVIDARTDEDGTQIILSFDEPLSEEESGRPPLESFMLSGTTAAIEAVEIDGAAVRITIAPAMREGDMISIAYSPPVDVGAGRLRDADQGMLAVAQWLARTVENRVDEVPVLVGAMTDAEGGILVLTFSEGLDETAAGRPAAGTFGLSGSDAVIVGATVEGADVMLQLDPPVLEGEAVSLSYAAPEDAEAGRLRDADQRMLAVLSWHGEAVTNLADGPAGLRSAVVDGELVELAFDQALDEDSTPAASAFSLDVDGLAVNAVTIDGAAATLRLSRALAEGELVELRYEAPSERPLQDLTGNPVVDFETALDNTTDTAPVPTSGTVNGAVAVIDLDQAIDTGAQPPSDHFKLSGTGASVVGTLLSNDAAGGRGRVTLSLSAAVHELEQVEITYDPFSGGDAIRIRDLQGNTARIVGLALVNGTDTAPLALSGMGDGQVIRIEFDQPLGAGAAPVGSAWRVGDGQQSVEAARIDDRTLVLTLDATLIEGAQVELAYNPPQVNALRDGTGNAAAAFALTLDNRTDYAPYPLSSESSVDGLVVTLRFDQAVSAPSAAHDAFAVIPDGPQVTGAARDGIDTAVLRLRLAEALREGVAHRLSYRAPSSGGLTDATGNAVATFDPALELVNRTDVEPRLESASVEGSLLRLAYDQPLDGDFVPLAEAFSVVVGEDRAALMGVAIAGEVVELTLGSPVAEGAMVSVRYQVLSERALRDGTGHQAEGFGPIEADNQTDTAPVPLRGTVDGAVARVTFDQALAEGIPAAAALSLGVGLPDVSEAEIDGEELTLRLAGAAPARTVIELVYSPPEMDGLADSTGNAVAAFRLGLENLTPYAPVPIGAESSIDGTEIVLRFDEALDDGAGSIPAASRFGLAGTDGAVAGVSVSEQEVTLRLEPRVREGDTVAVSYSPPLDQTSARLRGASGRLPAVAGWSGTAVENRTRATPHLVSAGVDGEIVRVEFDQALVESPAPPASAFMVDAASVNSVEVSVRGAVVTVQLSGSVPEGGAVTLTYRMPPSDGLRGLGGGALGDFTTALENTTERPPTPVSASVDQAAAVVEFDQPIDLSASPRLSHFRLTGTDAAVVGVSLSNDAAGGSGRLALTLAPPVEEGESVALRYDPTDGGPLTLVKDLQGNTAKMPNLALVNRTDTPPSPLSGGVDGETVELEFDQALTGAAPPAAAFNLGGSGPAVESTRIDGATVFLKLAESIKEGARVVVSYRPPETGGLRDATGNGSAAFDLTLVNWTDYAPYPVSATSSVDGAMVTVEFDQALAHPSVGYEVFAVQSESESLAVSGIRRDGAEPQMLHLSLDGALREAIDYVLSYTPPVADGLEDDGNNYVGAFDQSIRNLADHAPQPVAAAVDGRRLSLTFDQALDEGSIPPANCAAGEESTGLALSCDRPPGERPVWFAVRIGEGAAITEFDGVSVSGAAAVIELTDEVGYGDQVTVSYRQQDVLGLRDMSSPANPAESFDDFAVVNQTPPGAVRARVDAERRGGLWWTLRERRAMWMRARSQWR